MTAPRDSEIDKGLEKRLREMYEKSIKHDVQTSIPFRCFIGKTKAILVVLIEPDPHGDGSGTHAHFHTAIVCPKLKVAKLPEPDRCQITDETCPFVAPLGSPWRHPEARKGIYAHEIIQSMALIEFYGTQVVNEKVFKPLGLRKSFLKLAELSTLLVVANIINKDLFKKIERLRKVRNRLAHEPRAYLEFDERELFELSLEARSIAIKFMALLGKVSE